MPPTLLAETTSNRVSPSGIENTFKTSSVQAVAATATSILTRPLIIEIVQTSPLSLYKVQFIAGAAAAAGESLTIDFRVNGSSVLVAPLVYDNTQSPDTLINIAIDTASLNLSIGDILSVDRVYVAGGGPTPIGQNKLEVTFNRQLVSQNESAP